MSALRSAHTLEVEHEVIQRVVAAVSVMADHIDQGGAVNWHLVSQIVEFLREYVDHFHHAKEERALFPLLEERGVPPSGCPLAALRHEHEAGRALVSELNDIVAAPDHEVPRGERVTPVLRRLVKLYVEHMWKEDYLLIPMATKILSPEDDDALVREYETIEAGFDVAGLRRFEEFAASL